MQLIGQVGKHGLIFDLMAYNGGSKVGAIAFLEKALASEAT